MRCLAAFLYLDLSTLQYATNLGNLGISATDKAKKTVRYEIKNKVVTFFVDNPKRMEEARANQSFAETGLTEHQVIPLVECLIKRYRGHSFDCQQNLPKHFLRALFSYFKTPGKSWPNSSVDWQLTIYRFYEFYLTNDEWSQSKTQLRMRNWQTTICGLLTFLVEEELIPRDVVIPKLERRKLKNVTKYQPLLAEAPTKISDLGTQPQKLLVDINFGMNDEDYLNSVEKKCRHLINVIKDTCLKHWDGLMSDGGIGRQLAEEVKGEEYEEVVSAKKLVAPIQKRGRNIMFTSPAHPQGANWALAIVHNKMAFGNDFECISLRTLRASPFFRNDTFVQKKEGYKSLGDLTAMTQDQWQRLQASVQFYRFVGLLSHIDVAAVCCLLTIEHPEFTSESLQNAKLLDACGKPYLLLTDSNKQSVLSIDKPRAGRRKSVVLTPLSQKLVIDILRWTAPVRKVLKRAGDKTWRYLFLGVTRSNGGTGYLGVVEGKTIYLTGGKNSIGLTTLYPALEQSGLNKGSFDYRRLRNTVGILRWFETGSIVEMSRRMGNSSKVVLEHYLPPALLHAWNTRIIRRFQNTLIVLAAHDEPYLLEVTDFSNLADLQHFIAQLIMDYPIKTSPIADEVHRRLGSKYQPEVASNSPMPSLLNIRLSPKSVGFLYAYSDFAYRILTEEELDKTDVLSGLAPRQFVEMAALLRHAAESERIHTSLSESLDVPLLKQVHAEALVIQADLNAQFTKFGIRHQWAEKR